MKDYERLDKLQQEAEVAKERLIRILDKLEQEGFARKAKSLETIIIKLEYWQNTK